MYYPGVSLLYIHNLHKFMNDNFQNLYDFIDSAVRSRKYANSYAYALKVALKLFEEELNEDEKGSISVFKERMEQIYKSVFVKNSKRFSASSLATYKSRVLRVLRDYETYGLDPTKMSGWSSSTKARAQKKKEDVQKQNERQTTQGEMNTRSPATEQFDRAEFPLRSDAKVVIFLPKDRNADDIKKIKGFVKLLLGEE